MFVHILYAIGGAVVALVVQNQLSAKAKAAIQADLDAANAKLKAVAANVTKK